MMKIRAKLVTRALRGWRPLNDTLMSLTENEVGKALSIERANKRRANMLRRLHQRLNRLRVMRERRQLV